MGVAERRRRVLTMPPCGRNPLKRDRAGRHRRHGLACNVHFVSPARPLGTYEARANGQRTRGVAPRYSTLMCISNAR